MRRVAVVLAALALCSPLPPALASDHGDAPVQSGSVVRRDGDLTDLYAFRNGDNIVLILCSNPALPKGLRSYIFAEDLTQRIHIDNTSEVSFDDPYDLATYGGTIVRPDKVSNDIVFKFSFDEYGAPVLDLEGLPEEARDQIRFTNGLFDEPFISVAANTGPATGPRNIAAIVMEMPLSLVAGERDDPTLLIWATSKLPEVKGPLLDHLGRALWGRVTGGVSVNRIPIRKQYEATGFPPDVVIYRLGQPAGYPNGRLLGDDVRHLIIGEPSLTNVHLNPAPDGFPYLAPPN